MYQNFEKVLKSIREKKEKKRIAIAAAHDMEVMECAVMAHKEQIADFTLIGKKGEIESILRTF